GDNISYRSIKDKVSVNLSDTCVSDPVQPDNCLENWQNDYYIKYKWEITESPTPLSPDSQLKLPDSNGGPGQWIYDCPGENPKRAEFSALKVTPVRSDDENSGFDEYKCAEDCGKKPENIEDENYPLQFAEFIKCHQKYCEKFKTKYYKINVQAETVAKKSGNISATTDVTAIPRIIPAGRVQIQLSWKQGFKTKTESTSGKDGTSIDLDLHLIKKTSLEAPTFGYSPLEGVMGTVHLSSEMQSYVDLSNPEDERYFRHDDCSYSDKGIDDPNIQETIAWHASLDIDNTWGGNNFETPETINLGPIDNKDRDGIPDETIYDDEYLIVVGYVNCTSQYADKIDRCKPDYTGVDAAGEVDARVEIMVDGVEVPRSARGFISSDNFSETTKNFKIKFKEWKVLAVIKWDNSIEGGDAIVSDVAMPGSDIETDARSYKTCRFDYVDAALVPIWNQQDYYDWVNAKRNPEDPSSETIGECY
ncbi:MAG TPA: hypothetical protein PLD55_14230, partial [bacterium]|nr:hypothetical protein [bacterium]